MELQNTLRMMNLSNALSFLRAPLALLFLLEKPSLRLTAILLAMFTDSIDGYLARRSSSATRFGAILDPAMDKFFVFFALGVLTLENRLAPWQACSMISRDFFLCVFAIYLSLSGRWQGYQCRSIRWGKVTTALQFLVLIGLCLGISFPSYVYALFIISGCLAFVELCQIARAQSLLRSKKGTLTAVHLSSGAQGDRRTL